MTKFYRLTSLDPRPICLQFNARSRRRPSVKLETNWPGVEAIDSPTILGQIMR